MADSDQDVFRSREEEQQFSSPNQSSFTENLVLTQEMLAEIKGRHVIFSVLFLSGLSGKTGRLLETSYDQQNHVKVRLMIFST